jgi:hypothetical protein
MRIISAIFVLAIFGLLTVLAFAQDEPAVGPKPPVVVKPMESHIGNITGHAAAAKSDYRR